MRTAFLALIVSGILLFYACNSSVVQPTSNNPFPAETPDTVVNEYNNGSEFMGSYYQNTFPGLRIDSVEVLDTVQHCIAQGTLFIFFNNHLVDSIPYLPNYQWAGVVRPSTTAGYISQPDQYLLRVAVERGSLYVMGKSNWYFINGSIITKLPEVTNKDKNGIYENNSVIMGDVRKGNNKIIFFGEYYCNRQTYCTFDLNSLFKNYSRVRPDCYADWQWE